MQVTLDSTERKSCDYFIGTSVRKEGLHFAVIFFSIQHNEAISFVSMESFAVFFRDVLIR